MSLISEKVKIGITSSNYYNFKDKGYDIPHSEKVKFIRGSKIEVDVFDLLPNSSALVLIKCDMCGIESKVTYGQYNHYNHDGKTYCQACANKLFLSGANSPKWNPYKTQTCK